MGRIFPGKQDEYGGDNPQLRSFAMGSLPVVERHRLMMKELRERL